MNNDISAQDVIIRIVAAAETGDIGKVREAIDELRTSIGEGEAAAKDLGSEEQRAAANAADFHRVFSGLSNALRGGKDAVGGLATALRSLGELAGVSGPLMIALQGVQLLVTAFEALRSAARESAEAERQAAEEAARLDGETLQNVTRQAKEYADTLEEARDRSNALSDAQASLDDAQLQLQLAQLRAQAAEHPERKDQLEQQAAQLKIDAELNRVREKLSRLEAQRADAENAMLHQLEEEKKAKEALAEAERRSAEALAAQTEVQEFEKSYAGLAARDIPAEHRPSADTRALAATAVDRSREAEDARRLAEALDKSTTELLGKYDDQIAILDKSILALQTTLQTISLNHLTDTGLPSDASTDVQTVAQQDAARLGQIYSDASWAANEGSADAVLSLYQNAAEIAARMGAPDISEAVETNFREIANTLSRRLADTALPSDASPAVETAAQQDADSLAKTYSDAVCSAAEGSVDAVRSTYQDAIEDAACMGAKGISDALETGFREIADNLSGRLTDTGLPADASSAVETAAQQDADRLAQIYSDAVRSATEGSAHAVRSIYQDAIETAARMGAKGISDAIETHFAEIADTLSRRLAEIEAQLRNSR